MEEKIKQSLKKIRPILQRDGGDVEFIRENEGVVSVKLKGACGNCPGAKMTLKMVIEKTLKNEIDGVKEVKAI
ncbi:MAG: NifU family protein [Firmicutes bacterium]|nr:NifU family protein [Bacillota bacterium]